MGYNTQFDGDIVVSGLDPVDLLYLRTRYLDKYFGEDIRDHEDWEVSEEYDFYHINLEMDYSNKIKWDGSEKTYDMENQIRFIIQETLKLFPKAKFNGAMIAQGEDIGDIWRLKVIDNVVTTRDLLHRGICICPSCGYNF